MKNQELTNRIAHAINCESRENASNTPDFILASYLVQCLESFEAAVNAREKWYGRANDGRPAALAVGPGPATNSITT